MADDGVGDTTTTIDGTIEGGLAAFAIRAASEEKGKGDADEEDE